MSPSQPENFFRLLSEAQQHLDDSFAHLPPSPPTELDEDAAAILRDTAAALRDNYPYAHPLYAGQMLKPPHPIARVAYALAMSINPNNHARDGGRASSTMEIEAVAKIAAMFKWPQHLGHLTSGGTFANLEALWVAGQIAAEGKSAQGIAASSQAHYTHQRISSVLGLPFTEIPTDPHGRMDLHGLEAALQSGQIGTVVVTLGTTAIGSVDPLDQIVELQKQYQFRIHVDAAYGGYFTLSSNLDAPTRAAFDAIPRADSIVIDPHKHGLQPYGCGCVLFRDPSVGRFYKHDSPYTYFSSKDLHLGEISLECSRAGASAVALWATQRLLPYTPASEPSGQFARDLSSGREAALQLHQRLSAHPAFVVPTFPPALDILFWAVAAPTPAESSALAQKIFDEAARLDLHLALATLPTRFFPGGTWPNTSTSTGEAVLCLRSVLMKPEHLIWLDQIWDRLAEASSAARSVQESFEPAK
jgi:tyrosine decarboxylase / aspartate 1-decarboxylase